MDNQYKNNFSRRDFIALMGAAGATLPFAGLADAAPLHPSQSQKPRTLCVFSKHLQFLDYEGMAETAAEIGFDGVDLTVRSGGHVEPNNVESDLPKAVDAIKKAGLKPEMMATDLNDPEEEITRIQLETASQLGINYYRMAYLDYPDQKSIQETLEEYKPRLRDLAAINKEFNIHGAYQNHSGTNVGSPVWDLWYLLKDLDPRWIGVQYDIRHGTAEGGNSWGLGMKLLKDYISNTVIKDFQWMKDDDGNWFIKNVPFGEGMVEFDKYLQRIKSYELFGPVTFHYEYEMPEHNKSLSPSKMRKETIKVMKRDLDRFKAMEKAVGLR